MLICPCVHRPSNAWWIYTTTGSQSQRFNNFIIWICVFVSAYCCSMINSGWSFTVNVSSCLIWWFLARISYMVDNIFIPVLNIRPCKMDLICWDLFPIAYFSRGWFSKEACLLLLLHVSHVGHSTTMKYMKLITRSSRIQPLVSYLGLPACWEVYQPAAQTQFPPAPLKCLLP